jgi:hypothetical protein
MMGRVKSEQGQLFYQFQLGDAVPEDHLVRAGLYKDPNVGGDKIGFFVNPKQKLHFTQLGGQGISVVYYPVSSRP